MLSSSKSVSGLLVIVLAVLANGLFTAHLQGQARTIQPKVVEPRPLPPGGLPAINRGSIAGVSAPAAGPVVLIDARTSLLSEIEKLEAELDPNDPIFPPPPGPKIREVNRQMRLLNCWSPNIVLIVLNDVGYGDLGAYGQKKIRTPHIDTLAAHGIRFDQYYAGSALGIPSRATLMTGFHTGHLPIRGEGPADILQSSDITVAEVLWKAGYTTAGIGEWDLGDLTTPGSPRKQGFDYWYGFLTPEEAADPYPDFVWINEDHVRVAQNNAGQEGRYGNDLLADAAVAYLLQYRKRPPGRPFFLYMPLTLPGTTTKVPNDAPYTNEDWTQAQKDQAAILTRADDTVGRVMDALRRLQLSENTIVFVTSDNGHSLRDGEDPAFFNSSGGLRGAAGDLHEGGIRVPMIVSVPRRVSTGVIAAGFIPTPIVPPVAAPRVVVPGLASDVFLSPGLVDTVPRAHWDVLPTLENMTSAWWKPRPIDGISLFATPTGPTQQVHDYLYWQMRGDPVREALRVDDWKALATGNQIVELHDLKTDVAEADNVLAQQQEVAARIATLMQEAQLPLKPARVVRIPAVSSR